MSSKLNMQDIVDLLVANNDISKEESEKFIVEFINAIEKGLSTDGLVKVKDFGTFKLTQIQERESIDVNTQEKIVIPSHRRVSFVPAPNLKGLVNKPFAHFETTPLSDGIFLEGLSQDDGSDINGDDLEAEEEKPTSTVPKEDIVEKVNPIETVEDEGKSAEIVVDEVILPPVTPIIDNNIIDSVPKINLDIDDEKDLSKGEITDNPSKNAKSKKPKSRGKLRRYILRWDVAITLFVIVGVGVAYHYYFAKSKLSKQGVEDSIIPQPINSISSNCAENKSSESSAVIDSVRRSDRMRPEPVKTVKMSPGRTLRLIALDKFGNREFWIYIYLKNKDKIENPNVIPIGLILNLPNEDEFDMNANNPDDVSKAKKLGDQVMKGF